MVRSSYGSVVARLGRLRRFAGRADGQALIEIALVVSLASMVALGTISMTGSSIKAVLGNISGSVTGSRLGQTQTSTGQTATTPAPPTGKKKKKKG